MCWRSSGLRASISLGGYQSGHACLLWTVARPDQTKASAPDAHTIANGPSAIVYEIKKMTTRIDDDRSRPLVCRVGDDLAGEGGVRVLRVGPTPPKQHALGVP